jgi:hypothetical protein
MRRIGFGAALMWLWALPVVAQLQSGNLTGLVTDEQGGVLPGATVTVTGVDITRVFVTDADGRFRFLNLPPGRYTVTVELAGFTKVVREGIVVSVGANVDLPITLRVAAVEETITVTGESPIVDTKAMGTAVNFTQDELAKIPNSRDPWALLRTVPGVILDRVNIAGNETGQQSEFVGKGSRRFDATWTLDGVVITDMAATGASPTYFDYDAFEEIQISTGGQDIRQPTGGVGLNFVVKRGTNQFKGTLRGYYTGDELEASNVPEEAKARGVTPQTADHNEQITDLGADLGGPIWRDRAWFWGSFTRQDIRLVRSAGNVIDRTILDTSNLKLNWQATRDDMVSFLWFLGAKKKFGRNPGFAQREPLSATWRQDNFFPDNPFHGLWKIEDNRTFGSNLFLTGRYAYYGTGFKLEPMQGTEQQAGISLFKGETFGSTQALYFLRPQHTANLEGNYFRGRHEIRFGTGWRRADSFSQSFWPGDMVVGYEISATSRFARLYREGAGTNRTQYYHAYVADTITADRLTLDVGVRIDRQWGSALPSQTRSNIAFPNLVPGIRFDGYQAPFSWNTVSPRIGATYALDEARKTLLRASFARFPGQLDASTVGYMNPSSAVGFVDYPWDDRNGNNLVDPGEVTITPVPLAFGGGFDPSNPTAVTSANRIDPELDSMTTNSIVAGIERELMPNLAVQVNYTYTRSRNFTATPWRGVTPADYLPGPVLAGTFPDGKTYSVQTFVPNRDKVVAGGSGRLLTNYDGYFTSYHGLEVQAIKRMSNRWMGRLAFAWNNAREFYEMSPLVTSIGNPTRLDTNPLINGGQFAQRSAGSGPGDIFINARWQLNVNGAYQLPWDMEVAGNLFGRDGNPIPYFRAVTLGVDGSQRVLVSEKLDSVRFDDLWNLDLRWAKFIRANRSNFEIYADLFNVFNANTELQRERNAGSPNFLRLNQNLSPRIVRFGLRIIFG